MGDVASFEAGGGGQNKGIWVASINWKRQGAVLPTSRNERCLVLTGLQPNETCVGLLQNLKVINLCYIKSLSLW